MFPFLGFALPRRSCLSSLFPSAVHLHTLRLAPSLLSHPYPLSSHPPSFAIRRLSKPASVMSPLNLFRPSQCFLFSVLFINQADRLLAFSPIRERGTMDRGTLAVALLEQGSASNVLFGEAKGSFFLLPPPSLSPPLNHQTAPPFPALSSIVPS